MFEKEAEEYANGKGHEHYNYLFEENAGTPADFARRCFEDGAEFGYNKANEWHKVSDKLPEMDVLVYLWEKGKDFPVVACRHFPYGKKEWVWNCEWGSGFTISQLKGRDFLWKEIVLPKESE